MIVPWRDRDRITLVFAGCWQQEFCSESYMIGCWKVCLLELCIECVTVNRSVFIS